MQGMPAHTITSQQQHDRRDTISFPQSTLPMTLALRQTAALFIYRVIIVVVDIDSHKNLLY